MTEKRFSVDNHCNLYDNEYNVFYPIEGSRKNIELLCKRLNNLIDENNQLKKENKELRDFQYWVFKSMSEINQNNGDVE